MIDVCKDGPTVVGVGHEEATEGVFQVLMGGQIHAEEADMVEGQVGNQAEGLEMITRISFTSAAIEMRT